MASCTPPTRRTSAGSTASGVCISGSTGHHSVATRPVCGGTATTSTTAESELAAGRGPGLDPGDSRSPTETDRPAWQDEVERVMTDGPKDAYEASNGRGLSCGVVEPGAVWPQGQPSEKVVRPAVFN